ncbi:alpha-(1,3)-fucosyltransferase C-like [Ylistrum balloti]|uniref:alpha-(1,3)-fucosyltransferase C-like n=1 Tax=Ylistrum balloti TaxID=509963 RepID=UPI002905BAFD|nr:alpha-(1,3)-fucosyltransferase C-like [Ylistrum balloti]XP_060083804.1 alpha-(1,3)-fucosyltransferase C-like [Ylistrum balloti]
MQPMTKVVMQPKQEISQHQENIEVHYYNKPPSVSLQAFSRCPDRCSMTSGEKEYINKKIVIFHGPDLRGKPPMKYRGQLWIMQSMEPPTIYADYLKQWHRVFNWTLVHRRDSDIFSPYGSFAPNRSVPVNDIQPIAWTKKDKTAAWFVSNCKAQSRRLEYVQYLQRYVDIHIYGKCGNMSCPRSMHNNCLTKLQDQYKFYLAFENSLCADYITEKTTRLFQEGLDVIPIVRGTGELYRMHLPPNSFINAHDFTVKELAQKMKSISNNKAEFMKYFSWRKNYYAEEIDLFYCDLCKKLHNADKYKRLYESVSHWINDHPDHRNCQEPTDVHDS